MPTKTFTTGRIKKADYDTATRQLDLHWDNKTVVAYKHVPEEVYRRLCAAPNPTTYWEDRIAEEYPKGTPMNSSVDTDAAKKLSDLFGGGGHSLMVCKLAMKSINRAANLGQEPSHTAGGFEASSISLRRSFARTPYFWLTAGSSHT